MESITPVVITIGGWDPCGGAGLAADIKTIEQLGVWGMGVCSSLTVQNHREFHSMQWVDDLLIERQLLILLNEYDVKVIKLGLIPSVDFIDKLQKILLQLNHEIPIVWDPVLSATSGYRFHDHVNKQKLSSVLQNIMLLTPNIPECNALFNTTDPDVLQGLLVKNRWGNLLIKGGHNQGENIDDILITSDSISVINGKRFKAVAKHGTGCVLASAVAAYISKDEQLFNACEKGKKYVEDFILSTKFPLGKHSANNTYSHSQ